jgi:hypothetical protein
VNLARDRGQASSAGSGFPAKVGVGISCATTIVMRSFTEASTYEKRLLLN